MRQLVRLLPVLPLSLLLGGCLLDDWFGEEGSVRVSITDAPVDSVQQVRIAISALELKPTSRGVEEFEFDPPVVINNLLDLSGGQLQTVLTSRDVPSGAYDWLRIHIDAGGGDSFVVDSDGNDFDLYTPGQMPGTASPVDWVQLSVPFDVPDDDQLWLVLDVELRKSLYFDSSGGFYVLGPSIRLVDQDDSGSVSGSIDTDLVEDAACSSDPVTGEGNALYVFRGNAVTPGDIYIDESGAAQDAESPYTTAAIRKLSGEYSYKAAFLPAGTYTLAVTCDAVADDPRTDEVIAFVAVESVKVDEGEAETLDF